MNPYLFYTITFLIGLFFMFEIVMSSDADQVGDITVSPNKFYRSMFGASLTGFGMSSVALTKKDGNTPVAIPLIFLVIAAIAITLIRTQAFIGDNQWMRAMILHHSRAIFTSKMIRKRTKDPTVRKLANEIISSQEREIKEMWNLLG